MDLGISGVTSPIFGARKVEHVKGVLEAWADLAPIEVMNEVRTLERRIRSASPYVLPPQIRTSHGNTTYINPIEIKGKGSWITKD
ncbi:MAG: hypothetical protein CM1200mP39_26640 [Dehalococcoidia bacterium]|nr:MAG: hypothetical protein CM1200mP39_26640 [Dehalococcoidia bacterium]